MASEATWEPDGYADCERCGLHGEVCYHEGRDLRVCALCWSDPDRPAHDVATLLGVTPGKVRSLCISGSLRGTRFHGGWYVRVSDIAAHKIGR